MASYDIYAVQELPNGDAIIITTTVDAGEAPFRASLRDNIGCTGAGHSSIAAIICLGDNLRGLADTVGASIRQGVSPLAKPIKPIKPTRKSILSAAINDALNGAIVGPSTEYPVRPVQIEVTEHLDAQGERVVGFEMNDIVLLQLRALSALFATDNIQVDTVLHGDDADLEVTIRDIKVWPKGLTP